MISLCPFCQSKFVVSKQQLQTANGVIRCGVCMQLFMAAENEWAAAKKRERQKKQSKATFSPPPLNTSNAIKQTLSIKHKLNQSADDNYRILEDGRVEPVFARSAHGQNQILVPEFELDIEPPRSKRSPTNRHWLFALLRFVITTALVILLSAVLCLQWLQPAAKQIPKNQYIQQAYHLICRYIQCQKAPQASDYQSQKLLVRNSAAVAHGLIVETVIVNRSKHALPYPLLALEFRTLSNHITAQRIFAPSEYLHGELLGQPLLAPLSPVHISLEIIDPGDDSVNYTLRLLAPTSTHQQAAD